MLYARQCDNCRQVITPRGNLPPHFCPRCGARLRLAPAETPPSGLCADQRTAGGAVAALILGVLSFVPAFGLLVGLAAIGLGADAASRIKRSNGRLTGEAMATAGLLMGVLSLLIHLGLCLRIH